MISEIDLLTTERMASKTAAAIIVAVDKPLNRVIRDILQEIKTLRVLMRKNMAVGRERKR